MTSAPVIQIDLASPTPAYRQIANSVRAQLVSGVFEPGAQLPTVRQLALDLGVHHNTVAEAYRLLDEEGWLEMRRRHGVRVRDRAHPAPSVQTHESFERRLHELTAEARAEGLSKQTIAERLRALAQQLSSTNLVEE